nr:putative reverse transcriptase domain-containing protein [Tanacetum cinerariifolium]
MIKAIKSWAAPTNRVSIARRNGDFVVYCDASLKGYGAVLMQREKKKLNLRQRRWVELLSDYDCEILYHPKKVNVVADALSQKERIRPLHVRALMMTAQEEAMNKKYVRKFYPDGTRCFKNHVRLPRFGGLRNLVMHESHKSKYSIHPGSKKMYQNLKPLYCRQKSYADTRLKPLKFKVGDMVLLKVSPWKGAVRFGKHEKLTPCYIRPFKILAKVGLVAYTLELPEELKGIHSTFHVSNLKKCLTEDDVVILIDEIQLYDKLHMIGEPVEVVNREVKRLKQSRIPIVKVR